jgi:hypothetical protein
MAGIATPEGFVPFSASGALAAGVAASAFFVAPFDLSILGALASVGTAPTGGPTIFNFNVLRANGSGTVALYATPSGDAVDNRPQIAAGATVSWSEATSTAIPQNSPYPLNDPEPGGSVSPVATMTRTTTATPAVPDANTLVYAGDLVFLNILVGTGNTALGSNLVGTLHWLKN